MKEIEVFRDLSVHGDREQRGALRNALIEGAVAPWSVDLERSEEMRLAGLTDEDVLLFTCEQNAHHPEAGLTFWGTADGYYVPNITPLNVGRLSFAQYNAVLDEFLHNLLEPIAARHGFSIKTTKEEQGLDDWVNVEVASALRRFSAAANKSTGAGHPSDQRRWYAFIVASHSHRRKLDPDQLSRWLSEVDGWDEDTAHRLAGDFENALSLLRFYDGER
ncbi:hypothetical protein [Sinorhizobium chiapasense]|uniref:Uncharacterized protein n=1 Tax=Sinorhizobium chiapasense TaxID=501572 RepID=A0ABZ2BG94_9HYPH